VAQKKFCATRNTRKGAKWANNSRAKKSSDPDLISNQLKDLRPNEVAVCQPERLDVSVDAPTLLSRPK